MAASRAVYPVGVVETPFPAAEPRDWNALLADFSDAVSVLNVSFLRWRLDAAVGWCPSSNATRVPPAVDTARRRKFVRKIAHYLSGNHANSVFLGTKSNPSFLKI
jgi:hypothetical protein